MVWLGSTSQKQTGTMRQALSCDLLKLQQLHGDTEAHRKPESHPLLLSYLNGKKMEESNFGRFSTFTSCSFPCFDLILDHINIHITQHSSLNLFMT